MPTLASTPARSRTPIVVRPILASIVITPTTVWLSTPITVTGAGWPANASVVVGVAPANAPVGATGVKVAQARAGKTGAWQAVFTLPRAIPATTRQVLVVAYTSDRRVWGSAKLALAPSEQQRVPAPPQEPPRSPQPAPTRSK
jgi:hypothetical protein